MGNQIAGDFKVAVSVYSPQLRGIVPLPNSSRYPMASPQARKVFRDTLRGARQESKLDGPSWIPRIDPTQDPEWRRRFGYRVTPKLYSGSKYFLASK